MTYLEQNHPKPNMVIGYSSRNHLMLDLDNTTITKVLWLVKWLQRQYPKIGDCLIVKSSHKPLTITVKHTSTNRPYYKVERSSYHLIFDNNIGYNLCTKLTELLSGLGIIPQQNADLRHFRGDMTLRVSPIVQSNSIKPPPRIVTYIHNPHTARHDGLIVRYITLLEISRDLPYLGSCPSMSLP